MNSAAFRWFSFFLLVLLSVSLACSGGAPAPTAVPPATPVPPTATATATLEPTATPVPTATPDLAATEQTTARQELLQSYADDGYISSTAGDIEEVPEFQDAWAQIGWYQWYPLHEEAYTYGDLIFHGHFSWQTAIATSDLSGCGIVFGVQPNQDHYAVFLDKARIAFYMSRGGTVYSVGKTTGSGRPKLSEPGEADIDVIVNGAKAVVIVEHQATVYTLSADQSSSGEFAVSILSGTNRDFGTRCTISDAYIWTPAE